MKRRTWSREKLSCDYAEGKILDVACLARVRWSRNCFNDYDEKTFIFLKIKDFSGMVDLRSFMGEIFRNTQGIVQTTNQSILKVP